MNTVPNLKPHNPNNIPALGDRLRTYGFYLFFFSMLALQALLLTLTLSGNQVIPSYLSLRLDNFANLVQNNQYEDARSELNKINTQALGSIKDSIQTQLNGILAIKFSSVTEQILLEKTEFQTFEFNKGLILFQEELLPIIDSQLNQITTPYFDSNADYDKITYYLENLAKLGLENAVQPYQRKLESYYQSRHNFATANQYFSTNDYLTAIHLYQTIIPEDKMDFQVAQEKIKSGLELMYLEYLTNAASLANEQQYKEAYETLQTISDYYPNNAELLAKLANYKKAQTMVMYQGPIEHIFFHPLLAYPELGF